MKNRKDICLIPVCDISIELDKDKSVGYDFTVDDFFTFSTHDGIFVEDTMAVVHPLSEEAQYEAKTRMNTTVTGKRPGDLAFELSKDMFIGLYMLTADVKPKGTIIPVDDQTVQKLTDPYQKVRYKGKETTMGKALFNSCLPDKYPFFDQRVNKKIVKTILNQIMIEYGEKQVRDSASKMMKIGFRFSTVAASGFLLDDIKLPKEVYELKKQLVGADTEKAMKVLDQMYNIVIKHLEDTGLYEIADSGAGKGWGQVMQILVAKGLITDPNGNVLPVIKDSFSDGLTPTEFFEASAGARAGIMDRVLNTASTGYMERKLVYVMNSVEMSASLKDCGTTKTLKVKITKDNVNEFRGRYVVERGRVVLYDPSKYSPGSIINLRTPIYCKSKKLCHACYGRMYDAHNSKYVGVLAGSIIGERGMQLIMTSFHKGGAAEVKTRDIINDILSNAMDEDMEK